MTEEREQVEAHMPFPPDPDAGHVRPHAEIHDDLLKANIEIYELRRKLARIGEQNGRLFESLAWANNELSTFRAESKRVWELVAMGEEVTPERVRGAGVVR